MKTFQPASSPDLSLELSPGQATPTIPVICDKCRAEGSAGDAGFAEVADILNFEPVPRRAQVNAWSAEHQRAFIAALAITGSAVRAARALGRHPHGAEKLRSARGGKGFAEAWEAALELARERELARLKDSMAELNGKTEAELARLDFDPDEDEGDDEADPVEEARARIRDRLMRARRLLLRTIAGDADMRAAWEVLVGPVDWDKAERGEPQDNEPFRTSMRKADMILAAEAGALADITSEPEWMDGVREELAREGIEVPKLD